MAEEIAKRGKLAMGYPQTRPKSPEGVPVGCKIGASCVFNALRQGTVYKPARGTILACHLSDSRGFQGRKV